MTMGRQLPARFWFEAITAIVGGVLFVLTLFTGEWFELLTGWDPDGGNGGLELLLALGLLAISAASTLAARRCYRRSVAGA